MSAYSILDQNYLSFNLTPVSIRELGLIRHAPCNIFGYIDHSFRLVLKRETIFTKDLLKRHLMEQTPLFVTFDDHVNIKSEIQRMLVNTARSLSIGHTIKNARRFAHLLSLNMNYLYQDPIDLPTLKLQAQSVSNFANFLDEHPNQHQYIYSEVIKQKFHYTLAQPFLSSLLLISFLKSTHLFSPKDMEKLFITSYFKDIGMCVLPIETLDNEHLTSREKKIIGDHPRISVEILAGRVPLSANHLKIIENHHSFSGIQTDDLNAPPKRKYIQGIESLLVNTMDIVAAMITERPYRNSVGIFESLELIRSLISERYPQEFKQLVTFFHHFFSK